MNLWDRAKLFAAGTVITVLPLSCATYCARDMAQRNALQTYSETQVARIATEFSHKYGVRVDELPDIRIQFKTLGTALANPDYFASSGDYDALGNDIGVDVYSNSFPADRSKLTSMDRLLGRYNDHGHPVEETLRHEFGHYYADQVGETLGIEAWPSDDRFSEAAWTLSSIRRIHMYDPERMKAETRAHVLQNKELFEEYALLVATSEGIGEYFRLGSDAQFIGPLPQRDIVSLMADFQLYRLAYQESYHLYVRDILNADGVENGVRYLITNPPKSLGSLAEYRTTAIAELKE